MISSLIGVWMFTALFYQGQVFPPPNPDLKIIYEFREDHSNRLFYQRKGEVGFCEREAIYQVHEDALLQEITWVNPDNAIWCSSDVDMQMGYISIAPIKFQDGKFYLSVMMGEGESFFIWDRQ